MTEAEFLDIVARDKAARAMLTALEELIAAIDADEALVHEDLGEGPALSDARYAITQAKAAGIKAEG